MRVALEPSASGIALAELLRVPEPSHGVPAEWKVTPLLWKAGLDIDGLRAMLTFLMLEGSPPRLNTNERDLSLMPFELSLARLTGDEITEKRLRYGTAIYDGVTYYFDEASWADMIKSWLIAAIAGIDRMPESLPDPPEGTSYGDTIEVVRLIFKYLRASRYDESRYKQVLQLLFKILPRYGFDYSIDQYALTVAVIGRPELREAVPELQDFEFYGRYAEIVRRADHRDLTSETRRTTWQDPSDQVMLAVLEILLTPR
jgi:hypothetical protein